MPRALLTAGCCIHSVSSADKFTRCCGCGLRAFAALDALLDFEALDLASGGAGQIVLPDFVAQDALGGRHLCREAFDFEAQHVADVDDLCPAEGFKVRNDHGVQALGEWFAGRALQSQNTNLLDVGRLQIVSFDFFGVDVFAVAEDDDIFLASGDEEVAVGIAVAEVAAAEPSVAIHGGSDVGPLVVSGHDDAAAKGDFADAGAAVLGRRLAVEDFHFVAGQRLADRAHDVRAGRRDAGGAAGFGHAVTLQHGETHGFELASDGRVEARASGDEVAHAGCRACGERGRRILCRG